MRLFYKILVVLDVVMAVSIIAFVVNNVPAFGDYFISYIKTTRFYSPPVGKEYVCEDCNVIIVVFDSLRADHLHTYGYFRNTSPNINEFAEDAILFKNAYSPASWSKPSVASIFTSLYPSVHGSELGIYEDYRGGATIDALSENVTTIAEILRENGYRTIAFVPNWHLKSIFGYGQGFDYYFEDWRSGREINEDVISLIENGSLGKFFFYLHYMDTHHPYKPPKRYDRIFYNESDRENIPELVKYPAFLVDNITDINYYRAQYDSVILHADGIFGDLVGRVPDNTIIIFTADHGDELYEHGWVGHSNTMYEEQIHVPLIVRIPSIGGRYVVDNPMSTIDLMPTILNVLDIEYAVDVQGRNLMRDILIGDNKSRYTYSETNRFGTQRAIISDGYKLIYNSRKMHKNGGYELYDLNGLGEQNDIINQKPEIAEKMEGMMGEQLEDNSKHKNYSLRINISIDEDSEERLRSLGYI